MISPLHTVVETPEFRRRIARLLGDDERQALIDHMAANPDAGELMPGSGGARKLRWRLPGKGKSGGIRVITFFSGPPVPVFLMSAFGKGQRVNLSKAERNELRKILGELVKAYKEGARRNVQDR